MNQIILGDCLTELPNLPPDSIDLIVTDPPYGLEFMGKDWDKTLPPAAIWKECVRVLKPGAFAFIMCSPKQSLQARMILALEEGGFNVNFTPIYWAYASGFPKAQNISKAIDKQAGVEREVIGFTKDISHIERGDANINNQMRGCGDSTFTKDGLKVITKPMSLDAKALDGAYGGFQPKPAVEVILVCMKPLSKKTFVAQALDNQKGVTWLDEGRIPFVSEIDSKDSVVRYKEDIMKYGGTSLNESITKNQSGNAHVNQKGRFPANVLVSDNVLDTGIVNKANLTPRSCKTGESAFFGSSKQSTYVERFDDIRDEKDKKTFSRYFSLDTWWAERIKSLPESVRKTFPFLIVPKASKSEKGNANIHPTVKPIQLMSYLIVLGSREQDIVLDPFMGSGTTAIAARVQARKFLGYELQEAYWEIAQARIAPYMQQRTLFESIETKEQVI